MQYIVVHQLAVPLSILCALLNSVVLNSFVIYPYEVDFISLSHVMLGSEKLLNCFAWLVGKDRC